jgi:polyphosphate kinase
VNDDEVPPPQAPLREAEEAPPGGHDPAVSHAQLDERFFNRELSWLDFNSRVLELAEDPAVPILERVTFLGIFASNLDEFYMKRVGGLQRQRIAGVGGRTIDGLTPPEQLELIHEAVRPLLHRQVECWFEQLHPALKREGISIGRYDELEEPDKAAADDFFRRQVFPILTPLAVDPGHPFPFISNLSKSLGVMLEHPGTGEPSFVRIKLPENLPRWVQLPESPPNTGEVGPTSRARFISLEGLVSGNLTELFPGMRILESHLFRVTRNADVEADEEDADDLLALVEQELRQRRMARVVRLETPQQMSDSMREMIRRGLNVDPEDVYSRAGPIGMHDLVDLSRVARPELKFEPWKPRVPARLADEDADIFSVIRSGPLLVHHPYESFSASVERFVVEAADDPNVLALKMTLYRTSRESAFIESLIRAAEEGKQVAVLVELKARFDEQRNVQLAQRLEKAGVHVVYGVVGYKTHTKLAMAVRQEGDDLRTYCHIGTGNYNSRTAQLYTDVGLFTCDDALAGDVIELFHSLTGRSVRRDYRKLLVAPSSMRDRFLEMIRREIRHARSGRPAAISAKMNQLQDEALINALYEASNAGVRIDLVIRGFCCLRPGVPGLSENIRVFSILGRFLEHSRVFRFHNDGNPEHYLGSADWMVRNLDYRVEAIAPVEDAYSKAKLDDLLDRATEATAHAWQLDPDGRWVPRQTQDHLAGGGDYQEALMRRTVEHQVERRRLRGS